MTLDGDSKDDEGRRSQTEVVALRTVRHDRRKRRTEEKKWGKNRTGTQDERRRVARAVASRPLCVLSVSERESFPGVRVRERERGCQTPGF